MTRSTLIGLVMIALGFSVNQAQARSLAFHGASGSSMTVVNNLLGDADGDCVVGSSDISAVLAAAGGTLLRANNRSQSPYG